MTQNTIEHLQNHGHKVKWLDWEGAPNTIYQNENNKAVIDYGSLVIFEDDNTKKFKTYDFGDMPKGTVKLSKFKNFSGAVIGQYNERLWDELIENKELRHRVVSGHYPETYWQFGITNFPAVQEFRKTTPLYNQLYWRGSVYENTGKPEYDGSRDSLKSLYNIHPFKLHFNPYPIPFDSYIQEAILHKICLGFGGGGGYCCGDFCFRDIEMFGLGIPLLRPEFHVKSYKPLVPNYHYISVKINDCIDERFRITNPTEVANRIIKKYDEVINDLTYLSNIADNARQWYVNTISYPNIVNNLLVQLDL